MENNEKLLLKDLGSRLSYGVKLSHKCNHIHILSGVTKSGMIVINDIVTNVITTTGIENVKPYLFPLSSMTEEQRKEYHELLYNPENGMDIDYFDWCHQNHFDCRHLIPMGLAIDATNLNIY